VLRVNAGLEQVTIDLSEFRLDWIKIDGGLRKFSGAGPKVKVQVARVKVEAAKFTLLSSCVVAVGVWAVQHFRWS
jgi:hypothetical protein